MNGFLGTIAAVLWPLSLTLATELTAQSRDHASLRDRTLEQIGIQLASADLKFAHLSASDSIWQVPEYRRLQYLHSRVHDLKNDGLLSSSWNRKVVTDSNVRSTQMRQPLSWNEYLAEFELDSSWARFDLALPKPNSRLKAKALRQRSQLSIYPSAGENGNLSGEEFPRRTFSFTFDDGPSYTSSTEAILSVLNTARRKATFFQVVSSSVALEAKVAAEISEGHQVACHSWSHANLSDPDSDLELEITQAKVHLEAITKSRIGFYRLPYGEGDEDPVIRAKIAENRMIHVYWNIDSLDWADPVPESVARRVLTLAKSQARGVILFHDIKGHTAQVLKQVLPYFEHKMRHLCRLDTVVDYLNGAKRCWLR